jgi:predicted Zn finger-like uncharacterized protein
MIVRCPGCSKTYSIDDSLFVGKALKVRCRACGHVWAVGRSPRGEPASAPDRARPKAAASPAADEVPAGTDAGAVPARRTEPATLRAVDDRKPVRTDHWVDLEGAVRLQALVLALGECVQPPWWGTKYLSEVGLRYLERLFPRTAFSAALHAAGRAACAVHDRSIGRRGVHHLFRLPERLERDIRVFLTDGGAAEIAGELRPELGSADTLLASLERFTGGRYETGSGPTKVGAGADPVRAEALMRAAAVYCGAFRTGVKAFPYVEAE